MTPYTPTEFSVPDVLSVDQKRAWPTQTPVLGVWDSTHRTIVAAKYPTRSQLVHGFSWKSPHRKAIHTGVTNRLDLCVDHSVLR